MARKLERDDQPSDLEVLHPEVTLLIAGETLTVREYGFVEGLRLRSLYAPLLEPLHAIMASGGEISLESVLDVLAEHQERVLHLMAESAGVSVDWIRALRDDDGHQLMITWWGVNSPFFVRRLQQRLLAEAMQLRAKNRLASAPAGATSTQPSSMPDTTPTASAPTPSVS